MEVIEKDVGVTLSDKAIMLVSGVRDARMVGVTTRDVTTNNLYTCKNPVGFSNAVWL